MLEEEDEEVVLLAEVELLTEELLLLVGLAEVRWCRGMASVGLVTIAYTTKKEDGKEEREDAKVVSMVSFWWFGLALTLFAAVQLCPTTSGVFGLAGG